jgi:L-threonylcarbamoyladenylate synthase
MDIVERAVQVLRRDGIVVYPTETVYGLGGDAFSENAVRRVYGIKQRPLSQPMSVAVGDPEMLWAIARVDEVAEEFIRRFLPGPVTVVLPPTSCLPEILTGGTGLIGVRMPDCPLTLEIIEELDAPITATSANVAGATPPTTVTEVQVACDMIVDGGALPGIPSTVVDLSAGRILRPGALAEEIRHFLEGMG